MSDRTWTTKDGKELDVSDMTTAHIVNCVNMMERKIAIFKKEVVERDIVEEIFNKVKSKNLKDLKSDMEQV